MGRGLSGGGRRLAPSTDFLGLPLRPRLGETKWAGRRPAAFSRRSSSWVFGSAMRRGVARFVPSQQAVGPPGHRRGEPCPTGRPPYPTGGGGPSGRRRGSAGARAARGASWPSWTAWPALPAATGWSWPRTGSARPSELGRLVRVFDIKGLVGRINLDLRIGVVGCSVSSTLSLNFLAHQSTNVAIYFSQVFVRHIQNRLNHK